ncbi:MAG: TMEM175 family protein [Chthoniobacterales bacterium]
MRALFGSNREVSRLEGFSDSVFGFALTLLVVSLEVPGTYAELIDAMRGFGAFACCFAIVSWIWYEHNLFFRRYGLQDGYTIFLNLVLLFVVLFYVYPLKFIFTKLVGGIFGGPRLAGGLDLGSGVALMLIYSTALLVLFLIFALLHWHAYRHRAELALDPRANYDLVTSLWRHLVTASIALASIATALLLPRQLYWAGLIYFLLGPAQAILGFTRGMRRDRLPVG